MMNWLNTYRRYACDINRINEQAQSDPKGFIEMTEDIFRSDLRFIVEQILTVPVKRHIIMLSGPSSSGKTTTAQKLADEFRIKGCDVQHISMDDFYLGIKYIKTLPNGKPDFESVDALDIPLIKQSIKKLAEAGECDIPKYDFRNSCRTDIIQHLELASNAVIIIEGIHALNPIFDNGMADGNISKIYVSVKQGIKNGEDYVLTNREIRCIRRVVRDNSFREAPPEKLLDMWGEIVDGEKKYIRPYRYTSDFTVNSIHIYEPCIMKEPAIKLLGQVSEKSHCYETAQHLIKALSGFESIDDSFIPESSLMREFIGGGKYIY